MNTTIDLTPVSGHRDETIRQDVVAALTGSWRGRLTDTHGSAESFNLEREAVDHYVPGQVFLFTTPTGIAAGMRLLEANEHTFVALIGPYFDPGEGAMVVTVLEGLNLPRYPSVPSKLRAQRKPVESSSPTRPEQRLEKLRLVVPETQGKEAEILGHGPGAAPAVVEVLQRIGVA